MPLSHFEEKSGVVPVETPWGRWWQTLSEVFIEVSVPEGTRSKDTNISIKPGNISCKVHNKDLFSGQLCSKVIADECTWTLEENKLIVIMLVKAEMASVEKVWSSLLDKQYEANPLVILEMQKKMDLEKLQMEHPGFDFSGAKLDKTYDTPGLKH